VTFLNCLKSKLIISRLPGQLVRLDPDEDGRLLLAHVWGQEIAPLAGLVQHRIDAGVRGFLEGAHDRSRGLVRLR